MNYKNNRIKFFIKDYESKFNNYKETNIDEMDKYINKKIGELPNHQLLQQLSSNELLRDLDTVSLYPFGFEWWKIIISKNRKWFCLYERYEWWTCWKFKKKNFTQGSAILKVKLYNPKNLIVQHIPVKEKVRKTETKRLRNGYNVDVLTFIDIQ